MKTRTKNNGKTRDETVQVGCRFRKSELEIMKHDTGATGDATAVAGFVRKRIKECGK